MEERVDWPSFKKDLRLDLDNLVEIKLKESLDKKKMQFSFDSLSLSKQISDKIATPEGLVYLFNKPNKFIEQIREIFTNALPPEKINPPVPEKRVFEPEGPNFPDLFERIKYAFFTELGSFRLSLIQGGMSFTLDWQLQGISWRLTRMKIPIEKI